MEEHHQTSLALYDELRADYKNIVRGVDDKSVRQEELEALGKKIVKYSPRIYVSEHRAELPKMGNALNSFALFLGLNGARPFDHNQLQGLDDRTRFVSLKDLSED